MLARRGYYLLNQYLLNTIFDTSNSKQFSYHSSRFGAFSGIGEAWYLMVSLLPTLWGLNMSQSNVLQVLGKSVAFRHFETSLVVVYHLEL